MLRSQLNENGPSQPLLEAGTGMETGIVDGGDLLGITECRPTSRSSSKGRSLSLSDQEPPALSPSPKFREPDKRTSKDDSALLTNSPTTPRRPAFPVRGLSLQMPARDLMSPNTSAYVNRVPLSPKLDHSQTFGSPTSVLPRRSRGLDFSRAATNLHHSTLAEQSSPDSSPTISGRAMNIPNRKNGHNFMNGPDSLHLSSLWSTMANTDRPGISSSLGSVNMMCTDSSSNSSDDEDLMDADDIDDSILTTPQIGRMSAPFGAPVQPSPGSGWLGQSPAVSSLMNFQRRTLRHGKNRKGSMSGNGNSSGNSMANSISKSPPTTRSIDSMGNNFIGRDTTADGMHSRRDSISWAATQLHISGNESDDGLKSTLENPDSLPAPVTPNRVGVIRRAVTRRGNMLPKTKNFARIAAALAEETAPVETEVRREAEVVRQTRESDMDLEPIRRNSVSANTTTQSSPILGPSQDSLEGIPEDDIMADVSSTLSSSFKQHAMRNSKGKDYWDTFADEKNRTPPPFLPRPSSSGISEDILLDSPTPPIFGGSDRRHSSPSRSSTPQPTHTEMTQKMNRKRRRDDDLDPSSFKRRAVSPGMSAHNSPVMQSPMQRDLWGSRPSSNGDSKSGTNGTLKRVGFQGMVDTNDGLMKMSIE
ncbi:hypothetical protein HYALB_00013925 [Hymenoscyphus albidus]|uniref:Uncharacterized protein n=1 Tax=Hymenoscyphus albidus TaxID=595503 RepID=A0A9N9LVC7_9HELO|nr:hypothetical protein HYALB_00013925 [Hymenoscyphus albidus]